MSMVSHGIDEGRKAGLEFTVGHSHSSKGTSYTSAGSNVVFVQFSSSPKNYKEGQSLASFLDELDSAEGMAEYLQEARRELAHELLSADHAPTVATLRLERGLSQSDLSKLMGTSQAAISDYERRRRKPSEDALRALSSALGVDFNTIMDALANADA